MHKLNYTALETYGELMREAQGVLAGIESAVWGAYPDNEREPRGTDATGYALELRAIAIRLEREVRKLNRMTSEEADALASAKWDEMVAQEAGR